jgi:ribosomal protein S18 acetylase RimI-like enzyme
MEIKKASLNNLSEIKKISKEFQFELDRDWKELISSKESKMFILVNKKKIIGFTGLISHNWNNTIQISDIFVHPDYRGMGLAKKLVQYDIDKAKKTSFRCLIAESPSLNPVKNLYESMGLRKCGYNDRYYSNSGKEICIWMSLDLK